MDAKTEITMLELLHKSALENASVWKRIANAEKNSAANDRAIIWNIMGRGVKRENEFGDNIEVTLNINDWRELCEAVNFGV